MCNKYIYIYIYIYICVCACIYTLNPLGCNRKLDVTKTCGWAGGENPTTEGSKVPWALRDGLSVARLLRDCCANGLFELPPLWGNLPKPSLAK